MSELFYKDSDYKSFTPRNQGRPLPVYTTYADTSSTPDPSFGETFSAHMGYQWMPITNFTQEQMTFTDADEDEDFRWQDQEETNTYFNYMNELSRAKNREHYDFIINTIDQGIERRDTMDRGGIFPGIVAGILDPLNIAFAFPVFNVGVKAAWAAGSVLGVAKASAKVGFGFGIASETLRAPFDPMVTPAEIATNIGASTVMTGLLGGGMKGIANTYSHIKLRKLEKDMLKQKGADETVNVDETVNIDTSGTEQAIKNIEDRLPILKQLMFRGKYTREEGFQYVAELKSLTNDLKKFRKILKDAKEVKPKQDATSSQSSVKRNSIAELSDDEIRARYGKEFNIQKVVTDPIEVKRMKIDLNKPNVLGTHVVRDGVGTIYVDKIRAIEKYNRLKAMDKTKGYAELEKLKDSYPDSYPHSKFMFDNIDRFGNENEFIDYIILHEMHHGNTPKLAKESNRAYERRIDYLALERSQQERYKGSKNVGGIKETIYSRIGFISKFIPARIINESKDVNVQIKNDYNMMSHNSSVTLEGNQSGKAVQSLSARAKLHGGKAYALRVRMRERYMKEMQGREGTGEVMGIDVGSIQARYQRYMRGDTTKKTYDEWFADLIETHMDNANPEWHASNYKLLSENMKEGLDDLDVLFRSIDELAREVGVLGDDASLRLQIKYATQKVGRLNKDILKNAETIKGVEASAKSRGRGEFEPTIKQKKFIKDLNKANEEAKLKISEEELNLKWLNGMT
mgnify:FL=1